MENLIEIGRQFASSRTHQNPPEVAGAFLHPQCVYVRGTQVLIGRERILHALCNEPFLKVVRAPIENAIRISFKMHDELLVIENGLIVKIEWFTALV